MENFSKIYGDSGKWNVKENWRTQLLSPEKLGEIEIPENAIFFSDLTEMKNFIPFFIYGASPSRSVIRLMANKPQQLWLTVMVVVVVVVMHAVGA